MFSTPPAPFVGFTTTIGSPGCEFGFWKKVMLDWVEMFRATPSNVYPAWTCSCTTACSSRIGSFTTSCMGTPRIAAGRAGSGGLVPNGVRGFATDSGFERSYWVNPGGGAVSLSDEPSALITGGAVGWVANGVLLKDGKVEKA